jgi:hypothetical protein
VYSVRTGGNKFFPAENVVYASVAPAGVGSFVNPAVPVQKIENIHLTPEQPVLPPFILNAVLTEKRRPDHLPVINHGKYLTPLKKPAVNDQLDVFNLCFQINVLIINDDLRLQSGRQAYTCQDKPDNGFHFRKRFIGSFTRMIYARRHWYAAAGTPAPNPEKIPGPADLAVARPAGPG